jgi:hypothetical protein
MTAEDCDRYAAACEENRALAARWEALPLIVLAGLR